MAYCHYNTWHRDLHTDVNNQNAKVYAVLDKTRIWVIKTFFIHEGGLHSGESQSTDVNKFKDHIGLIDFR